MKSPSLDIKYGDQESLGSSAAQRWLCRSSTQAKLIGVASRRTCTMDSRGLNDSELKTDVKTVPALSRCPDKKARRKWSIGIY